MIYPVLRKIVSVSLSVFFKNIVVNGKENIPDQGPLLIVANHPNTLMDPLLVASITNQRLGFVANAGIFSSKVLASILRYFHVIPIYRKKDTLPGENPDNTQAFTKCHEYLRGGGSLLVFPEGSSYYELKLREIKTGTARIALSFEALEKFEGNLKILPIALDYSDSIQFRSMISISVSPAISLRPYQGSYGHDEFECVRQLTEDIRTALAKNIPHTSGKAQEDFLIKSHKFYTAYREPEADLYTNPKRSLSLRKQLSSALQNIHDHRNELYQDIQTRVDTFFSTLKSEGLTTGFFTDEFLQKNSILVTAGYFLKFIFLLPLYLFGLAANYMPYILPSKIYNLLNLDIEYKAPVQLVAGLITFPLFYILEIWTFRRYVYDGIWVTGLLLLLPISGYVAMFYWTEIKRFARVIHFYFFLKSDTKSKLLDMRDAILERIEQARKTLN